MVATKCYCRYNECQDGSSNGTCYLRPGGSCFTYFEEIITDVSGKTRSLEKRFGCFGPGDESILQCKGYLPEHDVYKNISCCSDSDYCNLNLLTDIIDGEIVFQENYTLIEYIDGISLLLLSLLLTFVLFTLIIFSLYKYRKISMHSKVAKNFAKATEELQSQKNLLPSSLDPFMWDPPMDSSNSSSTSDGSSGGSGSTQKCPFYGFATPMHNNNNISNSTIDSGVVVQYPYTHLVSSVTSNTSSFMSENTQQTTLSSQKLVSLHVKHEDSHTSGSGSGYPRLVQKTIAREISLKNGIICNGRFGPIVRGVRHCEEYAVKIFHSSQSDAWQREVEIYNNIRHENIVRFIGADVISSGNCTQLWLIMYYYELGSLYDFLVKNPIRSIGQMLSIFKSIAFGLSHLHNNICPQGRPRIAHMDVKSKNILMKSETSCVISDFTSAIIDTTSQQTFMINTAPCGFSWNLGTPRYMAPEILSKTLNTNFFENFIHADIYSLGLVFWEILNCIQLENTFSQIQYSEPYEEFVQGEPEVEIMKEIVFIKSMRPTFREFSNDFISPEQSKILYQIIRLIQECWSTNPNARLSVLKIKKMIIDLSNNYYK